MAPHERDAAVAALASIRNRQFAEMLLVVIGVAAETHPEELRAALAQAFDLSATEAVSRRAAAECQLAAERCARLQAEVRAMADGVRKTLAEIEQRIEWIELRCEEALAETMR